MDNGNGTEDFYIFYKATRVFIEWGDTESPTSSSKGIRRICSVTPQHFLLLLGNSKLYEASFDQCQLKLRMTCVRESVHDVQYCTDDRSAYLVLDNGSVLTQKLDDGCHSLTDLWQTVTFDPLELAEEGVCIKRVCCSADGTIFISDSCEIYALGNCGSHFSVDCFQPKLLRLFKDPMDVVDVSAGDNFFVFLTRKRKESKQVPPAAREYGELPDLVVCPETQHQRNETELSSSVHSSISHQNFELNVQHLLQFGYSLVHTEIYTMGSLNKGLLGTGDHIKRDSVVKIDKLQHIGVCSIATGRSHTVVRTIDGSFYHWGLNYEMSSPTELTFTSLDINTARSNILEACCGDYRTALLNTQGVIYDGDKEVMRQEKDFVTLQMKDGTQHSYPLLLASSDLTVYNRRLFKRQFCYLHHHLQNLAKTMLRYRKCCEQLKKIVELQQICLQWENVLYLTLTILNSLEQFYRGNYDDPSQLLIAAYFRECVYIFETYSKCYCDTYSIDGFSAAQQFCRAVNSSPATSTTESHNCENDNIGKIFKCPFQIFPHVTQLFEQLQKSSGCYKNELSSWHEFIRHNRIDMELAENTRDFWLSNQKNIKIAHFKRRERRVILSSTVVPIKTHSMMGLTTPVYILFSDCLCQLINHVSIFPLDAMWVKKDNSGIIIKTPEKKFTLVARNEIDCDLWYDQLESSIKSILNISEKSKIPEVRSIQYKFSNHSNSYSGVHVRGSFSNAVMHGKCHLQFPNGKIYAGEVRHGVIEGYGRMYIPKIGLYKGNFKNGKFFGRGTLIMNSKEIYEGNFRNGLFHGHGHLQLFDSIYVGEFEDNVKCGYGVLDILSSGEKYLGMFADNKRMGRGICITASGNYFEANFINDTLTGKSVAVFLNKYYYEGECTLNGPSGTGKYYMPVSESNQQDGGSIEYPLTTNWENTISGNILVGNLSGTWENVKINSGSMEMNVQFSKYPSTLGNSYAVNNSRKWHTLFSDFENEIFEDLANATNNTHSKAITFALWNRIVSFINKQQEIDSEKMIELENMNSFTSSTTKNIRKEWGVVTTSDVDKLSLNSSLFGCEQQNELNKIHSQSDDTLLIGIEPSYNLDLLNSFSNKLKNLSNENQAIISTFPTLMAVMESSAAMDSFNDSALSNSDILDECISLQTEMELIPPFGMSDLNEEELYDIKSYLKDAFRYRFHPLKHLNDRIAYAFYRSYGCWKIKPTSLLAKQAMREWESISQRLYKFIRRLFPALPEEYSIIGEQKEVVSHVTLLYPIVLTESIYSTLFVLYASIYSHKDELYRQNIIRAEKLTDADLIHRLEFDNDLLGVIETSHFCEAIQMLNELKDKYSPMAMLTVIENCMEKLTQAYQEMSRDNQTSLNADVIMPLTLVLLLRAGIHHLGAELALLDDLTDGNNFQFEMNGIRGYCLTTLKASYEHLTNKSLFQHN